MWVDLCGLWHKLRPVDTDVHPQVTLIAEGGAVLAVVETSQLGIACALDGNMLYIVTAPNAIAKRRQGKTDGLVEVVDVSAVQAARSRM